MICPNCKKEMKLYRTNCLTEYYKCDCGIKCKDEYVISYLEDCIIPLSTTWTVPKAMQPTEKQIAFMEKHTEMVQRIGINVDELIIRSQYTKAIGKCMEVFKNYYENGISLFGNDEPSEDDSCYASMDFFGN